MYARFPERIGICMECDGNANRASRLPLYPARVATTDLRLPESTTGSVARAAMSDLTATCADACSGVMLTRDATKIVAAKARAADFMQKTGYPGETKPGGVYPYDCLRLWLVTG